MRADEKPQVKRILLVDDDIDLLMLLERKLQRSGYIIESAASMPEAEYVLSLFKPHIVILDINVAGDDGRQLCWKIKNTKDFHQTKVILMSGYNYPINRQTLFGADDYLAKPFQSEYLLQKVTTLLNEEQAPEPVIIFPLNGFQDNMQQLNA
ncbi:MAG: response regulator [Chitinophagaceae bacterium]|nr:MAG: response regulator [Chitinophagaceae bacterium]